MLQMKFKPRFIEAFRSGQKTTTLRMMDFRCFPSDHDSDKFFHQERLSEDITIPDYSAGETLIFDKGAVFTRVSNLAGLLKRQPYQSLSNIELVTEIEGGETVPFAVAFINDISVIKGDKITDEHAIRDGFNPENHPLAELFVFMRDVYPNKDPLNEMYWLYTFTNIQMLSQWRA
ncbi:TPA: ASCH domain-containing protein, partial [Salmonella enterica subsp. enterica serovar Chester]